MNCNSSRAAALSRREWLGRAGGGFGALALAALCAESSAADARLADPLAARPGHFAGRAKQIIFLFSTGGASHVDTFDFKPRLFADHERLTFRHAGRDYRLTDVAGNVVKPIMS